MVRETALLIQLYWRVDRRDSSRASLPARAVGIVFGLAMVIFSGFLGFTAGLLITDPNPPIDLEAALFPSLLLTLVLVTVIFSGFNQALKALYLSGDLERLMVAPIHSQSVMTAKLLSRLPTTLTMLVVVAFPALIAFGIGAGLSWVYFVLGVLLLLVAPLFGLSLGALSSMFLVRWLPAKRLSEYLGAAYIVMGVIVAMVAQLPRLMLRNQASEIDAQTAESLNRALAATGNLPLPSMWAGRGLIELAEGQLALSALGGIFSYLLITVGIFTLTVLLANRLYLSGWLRMQGSGAQQQGLEERTSPFGGDSLDAALAVKDWLMRIRDTRQIAMLFSSVVFAAFFAFIMFRPGNDDGLMTLAQTDDFPANLSWLATAVSPGVTVSAMLLFLGWSAFSTMSLAALSLEGPSFYTLKIAPIDPRRVLRGKVLGIVAPYTLFITLIFIASWYFIRFSLLWMPYAWLCLLIIGYGWISFATAMGFLYPKLDWEDPRRMTTGNARIRNMAGILFYALPVSLLMLAFFVAADSVQSGIFLAVIGLLILSTLTWVFVAWSGRLVERAWPSLGEG